MGNTMLEIKPTGQHGCMVTQSSQNGNKAVNVAASQAFTRWLHHQYTPVKLLSV